MIGRSEGEVKKMDDELFMMKGAFDALSTITPFAWTC
jgi:hypothetical protein